MEEKINYGNSSHSKEDEIDLLKLVKTLWEKRKIIFLIVCAFFLLGVFLSFLQTPPQFKSETSFLLKSGGSGGGMESLGGLAALTGASLPSSGSSSGSEISSSLYPKFISSIQFKKALLQAPLTINGKTETVTYAYYYENIVKPSRSELIRTYTLGLPSILMSKFNPSAPIDTGKEKNTPLLRLSSNELGHFARLENQLKVEPKEGVFILSFTMPEPLLAAQMADFSFKLLQKEVVDYKLGNLREELRFNQLLYDEKKKEFEKIQNELGYFRDRNQNVVIASVLNQMERLKSEYSLKLSVFTQVANSLEATKLQIARDTPIFSVLDPVTIPNGPQAKNSRLVILIFIVLGVVVAFAYVLGGRLLEGVKNQWDSL
jgi:hypothetical protein